MEQHCEQCMWRQRAQLSAWPFLKSNLLFFLSLYLVLPLGRVLGVTFQLELSELNPSKGE